MLRKIAAIVIVALPLVTGCTGSSVREYPVQGQILAVDTPRRHVTIKHEDIPNFMPGMTMTFSVREEALLEGRVAGDLVSATLVVGDEEPYLRTLERTGYAPVAPGDAPATAAPRLEAGQQVADANFLDERGEKRTLADWRGSALAITFVYTRCPLPNFCPLMDRHFKAVQDAVNADAALAGKVRLLSVTFDPAHDTPAVLAKHARAVGADPAVWSFLTGEQQELRRFAAQFGVSILRDDKAEAAGEIVHNLRTAVIDGDGRLVKILPGGDWTPAELTAALRDVRAGR